MYHHSSSRPLRIIADGQTPYLERYYLTSGLGCRFYLHRFVASDPQRGWHDHPWTPAVSVVLWGEYGEERIRVSAKAFAARGRTEPTHLTVDHRIVRWVNLLTRGTAHRVVVGDDWTPLTTAEGLDLTPSYVSCSKECWSLFVHRDKYTTGWGFWTSAGVAKLYRWLSFTGRADTSVVTSGDWWTTATKASHNAQRVAPLYPHD